MLVNKIKIVMLLTYWALIITLLLTVVSYFPIYQSLVQRGECCACQNVGIRDLIKPRNSNISIGDLFPNATL